VYCTALTLLSCLRFPTPGLLDGITSKEKHICKLTGVSFSYPRTDKFRLAEVDVAARLSSRVAVIGPNGAGKSVSGPGGGGAMVCVCLERECCAG
jgi:elongation factor 3